MGTLAARRGVEIAVLDVDPEFRASVVGSLEQEGDYFVRGFERTEDLMEACRERAPGIVLLDLESGEARGGGELLEHLLARWPGLCVIIVTGHPSLEEMRATFKLRVFDYLVKPFPLAQLHQTIVNAVRTFGIGHSDSERLRQLLGHRLRVMRAERDWALKDLAAAAGLSISQISSIERGAHLPSVESLLAIARAFQLHPSQLLSTVGF